MSGRNVNLTEYLSTFVDAQVRSGRHQNASEVVREALRRYDTDLTAETARAEAIGHIIREGREALSRGDFIAVESKDEAALLLNRLTRQETTPTRRS